MLDWPVAPRKEWTFAAVIAAAASLLFFFPYALGHLTAPVDTVFAGTLINIDDGTYLSAIEQGRRGAWKYQILFTSEEHKPIFVEGFYLTFGHIGRLLGLSTVQTWHFARLSMDFVLFIVLYAFVAFFVKGVGQRRLTYFLAIFGAGYDLWRFPAFLERTGSAFAVPVDLRMPESHLFYSALTFPHFSAGITLIMLSFLLVLTAWRASTSGRLRWFLAIAAGAANLGLGIVYPFLIYLVAPVLGVYYIKIVRKAGRILRSEGLVLVTAFAIPLPLYLYYVWALIGSETFMAWSEQAGTRSPNPLHYVLAYLPYLLLGILSLRHMRKLTETDRQKYEFILTWVVIAVVLLYFPIDPQRRYVEGLQVPLSILAADGLFGVAIPWILKRRIFAGLLRRPRYSEAGLRRL